MKREEVLGIAKDIISSDREETYGNPASNFDMIAKFWSAYLNTSVTPEDVGLMMCLLKIARAHQTYTHLDNFVDLAGYAALAGELATTASKGSM